LSISDDILNLQTHVQILLCRISTLDSRISELEVENTALCTENISLRTENTSLKVEKIETEQFVGTKIGDRMVLFSKNSEVENQAIKLKIAHSGITKVLITDLETGTWDIECIDNKKQSIGIVKNSKNLLYFNAAKGTYVITKK
jgi:regulator of replication initiation timing